jgi:hypothetical protein
VHHQRDEVRTRDTIRRFVPFRDEARRIVPTAAKVACKSRCQSLASVDARFRALA